MSVTATFLVPIFVISMFVTVLSVQIDHIYETLLSTLS